jgi:hypothetical protein
MFSTPSCNSPSSIQKSIQSKYKNKERKLKGKGKVRVRREGKGKKETKKGTK